MFEGFKVSMIDTGETMIRVRHGGSGPPLLLLHGHPQTHVMWHKVAPRLARALQRRRDRPARLRRELQAADDARPRAVLEARDGARPGRGHAAARASSASSWPATTAARASPTAWRSTSPERVLRLAVLDIIPTSEAFRRADMKFGLGYWHWFFLAQPADLPELLIGADPDDYWFRHTSREPKSRDFFGAEALAEYLRCFRDPQTRHAICEDYRAAATVDCALDEADRGPAAHSLPGPRALGRQGRARGLVRRARDLARLGRRCARPGDPLRSLPRRGGARRNLRGAPRLLRRVSAAVRCPAGCCSERADAPHFRIAYRSL